MKRAFLLLLLNSSLLGFSQKIKKERIVEVLSILASDEMKGRNIGTPENDKAAQYIAGRFKENNLDYCVGNSYLIPFDYQGKTAYNVCGIKRGKTNKFLAFTGHFDHIGFNNNEGDNIYNGADDNASGTTAVIGMADYFRNKRTDFSHIYIAFNGEEHGMKGSFALAHHPQLEDLNQNIQAMFNFEMLGMVSQFGKNTMYMTGDDFSDFDELINQHAKKGLKIYPDPYKQHQLFYRSDNVSYAKKNVLAHSFSTVDMSKATHYHQMNDDISVIDFDNLHLLINSFAKTISKLNTKNFQPKYNENVKL